MALGLLPFVLTYTSPAALISSNDMTDRDPFLDARWLVMIVLGSRAHSLLLQLEDASTAVQNESITYGIAHQMTREKLHRRSAERSVNRTFGPQVNEAFRSAVFVLYCFCRF